MDSIQLIGTACILAAREGGDLTEITEALEMLMAVIMVPLLLEI